MFFAVAAFFLWRRDPGKRYLLGFVVAPVAIGIAMTVNHYAPDPESMASRLTVQISSIIASISVVWAACTRLARPVPLKTWIAAGAMVGVLNAIAVHVGSFTASYFLVNWSGCSRLSHCNSSCGPQPWSSSKAPWMRSNTAIPSAMPF